MKHFISIIICLVLIHKVYAQEVLRTHVHFDFSKFELKNDAKEILNGFKAKIPSGTRAELYVYGHTDGIGSKAYNEWLGQKRAEAVKIYLGNLGVPLGIIATRSYGKTQPEASNRSAYGRMRNRRVEVELCIYRDGERTDVTTLPELKDLPEQPAKNQPLVFENGTLIYGMADAITPYNIKNVKFDVTEILSPDDMLKNHATTQDKDGNSLISGGMVLIKATIDGNEINAANPYTVDIPVDEYAIDKEMELFTSLKRNGKLVWQLTKIPVKVVQKNDKYYYEFTVSTFGGFNCDKYRKFTDVTRYTNHYEYQKNTTVKHMVKIRSRGYNVREAFIYDKKTGQLVYGDIVNKHVINFNYQTTKKSDFRLYVSAYRGKQLYYLEHSMKGLTPKTFSSTYVLENWKFGLTSQKQLDKRFASR